MIADIFCCCDRQGVAPERRLLIGRLTYGEVGTPELRAVQAEWRAKAEEMKRRRSPRS